MFLGSAAAASAIGFINMVGNLGGFYGPLIVGELSSRTTSFGPALEKIAPWPIYSAVIILLVGLARRWQQRRTTDRMVESLGE
jgi:nitrate/nitrite transporter NarK